MSFGRERRKSFVLKIIRSENVNLMLKVAVLDSGTRELYLVSHYTSSKEMSPVCAQSVSRQYTLFHLMIKSHNFISLLCSWYNFFVNNKVDLFCVCGISSVLLKGTSSNC